MLRIATIYDLAKLAGVAPSTVSKALNGYPGVSAATRQRILQLAAEQGFTPNPAAVSLVTGKSWLVGVIINCSDRVGINHPHFGAILQAFQERMGDYGYDLVFMNGQIGGQPLSLVEHCRCRGLDGVLLAADASYDEQIAPLFASALPRVSVEGLYRDTPTVICDNRSGIYQAMAHLYHLGHRKIAMIASFPESLAGDLRTKAYLDFLEEKGLSPSGGYIAEATSYSREGGHGAAVRLMQQTWRDPPTGIVTSYDEYACAAIPVLESYGFRVPEDISVVGFDDLPIAQYTLPGITTVRQERRDIGRYAAEVLAEQIGGEKPRQRLHYRPTALVVRGSTARVSSG